MNLINKALYIYFLYKFTIVYLNLQQDSSINLFDNKKIYVYIHSNFFMIRNLFCYNLVDKN